MAERTLESGLRSAKSLATASLTDVRSSVENVGIDYEF